MQTIQQHINGLTTAKDAHAQLYIAAETIGQIEPLDIGHKIMADTSKRKFNAISAAIEALKGAL